MKLFCSVGFHRWRLASAWRHNVGSAAFGFGFVEPGAEADLRCARCGRRGHVWQSYDCAWGTMRSDPKRWLVDDVGGIVPCFDPGTSSRIIITTEGYDNEEQGNAAGNVR